MTSNQTAVVSWATVERANLPEAVLADLRREFDSPQGIPVTGDTLIDLTRAYGPDTATYVAQIFPTAQACQRFVGALKVQALDGGSRLGWGREETVDYFGQYQDLWLLPREAAQGRVAGLLRAAIELVGTDFDRAQAVATGVASAIASEGTIY